MGGLSNALEQRKQIIAELRTLNARMERIESKLAAGLNVKVTDMPALKLPDAKAGKEKAEATHDAAKTRNEADYKVGKEKCDAMSGNAKDACLADLKTRYGK